MATRKVSEARIITAIISPMLKDYSIDYEGAKRLARFLVENGSDGVVVCGTTGESPALSADEKLELTRVVREAIPDHVVVAGVGTNSTSESVKMTRLVEPLGVDAVMAVTPYYNKPPQEGLYNHFMSIAEATSLPVMIYNVPSRTAVNISSDTVLRLAESGRFCGIKEASGDLDQMARIIESAPPEFRLWSGDDSLTLPVMSIGGYGVVSVASHICGRAMKQMIEYYLAGNVSMAAQMHRQLLPIFKGLFIITSPIPLKAVMNMLGLPAGPCRPPLCEANDSQRQVLSELVSKHQSVLDATKAYA